MHKPSELDRKQLAEFGIDLMSGQFVGNVIWGDYRKTGKFISSWHNDEAWTGVEATEPGKTDNWAFVSTDQMRVVGWLLGGNEMSIENLEKLEAAYGREYVDMRELIISHNKMKERNKCIEDLIVNVQKLVE